MRLLHLKEYPDYKYRPKKRTRSGSDGSGLTKEKQEKGEEDGRKRMRGELVDIVDNIDNIDIVDNIDADFQLKREAESFATFPTSLESFEYNLLDNQTLR